MRYWEGESIAVWERKWNIPYLEIHESLPSTNDRARELARERATPFSVVIAEAQTAGKGRAGKRWDSPAGMGLWLSFLLTSRSQREPVLVPILAGLAVARAIEALCSGSEPKIKWPNDIELDGRKVAGILCEGEGAGTLVVGIGVNVRQAEEDFDRMVQGRAISLEGAGYFVERGEFICTLFSEVHRFLDPLPKFLDESLRREFECRDTLIGRMVSTDAGLQGRAMGISSDGALILEVDGTLSAIRAGSVRVNSAQSKKQT